MSHVTRQPCVLFRSVLCLAAICSAGSAAAAEPAREPKERPPADGVKWQKLFDGKALGKWKVIDEFDFKRHGKVRVVDGAIVMPMGAPATGVKWTGPFPKNDYEIAIEARRVEGVDFFASMTFPVSDAALTLVVGGWGGQVVGLSSIFDEPAVENETCQYKEFEQNKWYRIRLRVTGEKIEAWLDKEKLVDFAHKDRKLTIRWEQDPLVPFGISSYRTTAALRNVTVRPVGGKAGPAAEGPQLAPVDGVLTLDGQPVAGATLQFIPKEGRPAVGRTDQNGKYALTTFVDGDGALPGTYRVAIVLNRQRDGKTEWIVPRRYSDPKTSGLTVSVAPSGNTFDFDLCSN